MMEQAQDAMEHAFQAAKEATELDRLWEVAETAAQLGFAQKAVELARQISRGRGSVVTLGTECVGRKKRKGEGEVSP